MKERHIIIILVLVLVVLVINIIQKKYIDPKYYKEIETVIKEDFTSYIIYKNDHMVFSLYMTDDSTRIAHSELPELGESEAFHKPDIGEEIQHIIKADVELYKNSRIGDKIEKLPNSNKCYLYRKDSIFKYNCYLFTDKERQAIGKRIDEWNSNETGFWKLVK